MKQKSVVEFGGVEVTTEAFPPKVTILNNIFPPLEELQNCTTCHRGRQLPADKLDRMTYCYYCRWDLKEHNGARHLDSVCPTDHYMRKREEESK